MEKYSAKQEPVSPIRIWTKVLLFVLFVILLNGGGSWLTHQIDFQLFPRHEPILHFIVLGFVILYVLLMAIPFMPGIEIGLALMFLLGHKGALLIYLCTLIALSISFMIGRTIPARIICILLDWFHFYRASVVVSQLEPLNPQQRLEYLYANVPKKHAPILIRYRYLAIGVLLNLPGNAVIGGGGGIGLIVGMSKLVPYAHFFMLVAVAVAPVPMLFFFEII